MTRAGDRNVGSSYLARRSAMGIWADPSYVRLALPPQGVIALHITLVDNKKDERVTLEPICIYNLCIVCLALQISLGAWNPRTMRISASIIVHLVPRPLRVVHRRDLFWGLLYRSTPAVCHRASGDDGRRSLRKKGVVRVGPFDEVNPHFDPGNVMIGCLPAPRVDLPSVSMPHIWSHPLGAVLETNGESYRHSLR